MHGEGGSWRRQEVVDVNGPVEELLLLSTMGKGSLETPQMVLTICSVGISLFGWRFWAKTFLERASATKQMPLPLCSSHRPTCARRRMEFGPLSCSEKPQML